MRKIETAKGTWKVHGIDMTPSDSCYLSIKAAIESENLSQEHLQKITGFLNPITIDWAMKTITFHRF